MHANPRAPASGPHSQDRRRQCRWVAHWSCQKGTTVFACRCEQTFCVSPRVRKMSPAREHAPSVTTAFKFWTGYFLLKFAPIMQSPGENLEVLHLMSQIWHVLSCKSLICTMHYSMRSSMYGLSIEVGNTHDHGQKPVHQSPLQATRSASHPKSP